MPKDEAFKEAEQKIQQTLQSGATELDLSRMALTELPDSLGQLTQLTELNLFSNQLTSLPDSLGQLTQLTSLNLSNNQLTTLPPSLGQLTQLQILDIHSNHFTELPKFLVNLTKLETLYLGGNQLVKLPEWMFNLKELKFLRVWYNQLKELPESLVQLIQLQELDLGGNKLTDLPPSLAQLEQLKELKLDNNPLNPALQSAYDAGLDAVKAYLRSLENAEPLYEAKLVLVGEGNVGKTTLLKALKGKAGAAPQEHEPTTHSVEIDIHGLRLPHPAKDGVEIQLNAWDFGGQDVYRVTHQFFFSRRSLYLLVWEPRRGVQQGQVEDWLNMIRLRVGDDARVIIVSTHCKTGERIARIDQPVFKQQYGEMVGIAELKKVIAEHASKLEQMGMGFNRDWKAARDELLARPEPRISFSTFSGICAARGLSGIDTETLAHLMHDLGYIVHYSDDEKLRDDVILKPEWLTKAIGFVARRPRNSRDGWRFARQSLISSLARSPF
jgi:Leucine-rich repeat (LRR) protein